MEFITTIVVLYHQGIEIIKLSFLYICFIISTFTIILWLSMFSYGCFYYIYMPIDSHSYPIYWQFNQGEGRYASYPNANISLTKTLVSWQKVLAPDQQYRIVLEMELPDSPNNRELGMFMCNVKLMTSNNDILATARRFAMLQYQSAIVRLTKTIIMAPLFLLALRQEEQMMSVTLFEKFVDNRFDPASYAWVMVESDRIEMYTSYLKIHAQYRGLRYIMFHWPTMSALYGVCSNAVFLSLIAMLSWYQYFLSRGLIPSANSIRSQFLERNVQARGELRKSTKQAMKLPEFNENVRMRRPTTTTGQMDDIGEQPVAKVRSQQQLKETLRGKDDKMSDVIENREILGRANHSSIPRFNDEMVPNEAYARAKKSLEVPKRLGAIGYSQENLHPQSYHTLDQYISYNMPPRLLHYLPNSKEKMISKLVQQIDLSRSISHGNIIDFNLYDEALSNIENKHLFFNTNKMCSN